MDVSIAEVSRNLNSSTGPRARALLSSRLMWGVERDRGRAAPGRAAPGRDRAVDVTEAPSRQADPRPPQGVRRSRRVSPRVKRAVALAIVLLGWEALSRAGVVDPFYAPPPAEVADVLRELFATGDIYPHLQATFTAALGGLVIGVVVGALGLAAALVRTASELLEPVMMALNAVPRVILAPLFMIWFGIGIGIGSKVALSFLLVSVLMFFSVFSGIKEGDQRLVERIRSFGGGTGWLARDVYWPSVTAWVMSNLKVAVGFSFTGAVVGEFAATKDLGYLMAFAQSQFNTPLVFALITLVMVFVLTVLAGRLVVDRSTRSPSIAAPTGGAPRSARAASRYVTRSRFVMLLHTHPSSPRNWRSSRPGPRRPCRRRRPVARPRKPTPDLERPSRPRPPRRAAGQSPGVGAGAGRPRTSLSANHYDALGTIAGPPGTTATCSPALPVTWGPAPWWAATVGCTSRRSSPATDACRSTGEFPLQRRGEPRADAHAADQADHHLAARRGPRSLGG